MRVKLICVGKTNFDYIEKGCLIYQDRLKHFTSFEMLFVQDIRNTKKMPVNEVKRKEGIAILKSLDKADKLCLLDEKGSSYTSEGFAGFIEKQVNFGVKQLVFVIGGAFGFSEEVYQRADFKLSLSKMTFSHQIIRVIFLEQLYRAFTIIKGIPYHNQ